MGEIDRKKYFQGGYNIVEKSQMCPTKLRLVTENWRRECEEIVENCETWIDLSTALRTTGAGNQTKSECNRLFSMKFGD